MKNSNRNPNCKGCIYYRELYYGTGMYVCNYILDTGEPRKCKSENCDKRKVGKRTKRNRGIDDIGYILWE